MATSSLRPHRTPTQRRRQRESGSTDWKSTARRRAAGERGGAGFGTGRPVRTVPGWAVAVNNRWSAAASEARWPVGVGWGADASGGMVAVSGDAGTVTSG
jgi:hypothetical protein